MRPQHSETETKECEAETKHVLWDRQTKNYETVTSLVNELDTTYVRTISLPTSSGKSYFCYGVILVIAVRDLLRYRYVIIRTIQQLGQLGLASIRVAKLSSFSLFYFVPSKPCDILSWNLSARDINSVYI